MHRNLTDFPKPPKPPKKGKLYPDSKKLEAVKLWLLTGNLVHTAAFLNIPHPTLRQWRYTEWWKDLVEELRQEETIELSNRLKRLAEKSMTVLEDRLENGDFVLKDGELVRKPVNLRDTTLALNSVHDRRQRMLDKRDDKQDNKQQIDRLAALAAKFEEIAGKRQPIQVTDVVFGVEHAVHDQREEGLQEGVSLGAQEEAQSGEGSRSQELSQSESRA